MCIAELREIGCMLLFGSLFFPYINNNKYFNNEYCEGLSPFTNICDKD